MKNSIVEQNNPNIIDNPWSKLREYTDARIGLGRSGVSIPTSHLLDFQLAHAQAQDAVHLPLDINHVIEQINDLSVDMKLLPHEKAHEGLYQKGHEFFMLHSQAKDRVTYLQRPDLGRRLESASCDVLKNHIENENKEYDLSIVIVDGLSSLAVKENAINFTQVLLNALCKESEAWKIAPFSIVEQGRVAVADEVGELLKAKATLVLIGERPGLSSPDSLGLYLTWDPKVGRNDAHRNCISNVRSEGLSYEEAVKKVVYLLKESRKLKLSGVNLKDRTTTDTQNNIKNEENFLIEE